MQSNNAGFNRGDPTVLEKLPRLQVMIRSAAGSLHKWAPEKLNIHLCMQRIEVHRRLKFKAISRDAFNAQALVMHGKQLFPVAIGFLHLLIGYIRGVRIINCSAILVTLMKLPLLVYLSLRTLWNM